ncbi:rRNA pseudouridine synthase [Chelatococcus asaccharovorans]|nr:rRNA pseudouridine synthase [Chelatococcus asaccharovorans]
MARAGVASRRDAEVMIEEGRVAVNGEVLTTPATLVGPEDVILVDGVPMPSRDRTRLWFFHKPRGLVTTAKDPEGRPTVFEALPPDMPRVVTVGRLDINTEGLLLLTNDGGLAKVLAHPTTGWLRRYRVRAYGEIDQAKLDTLAEGVTVDGMHYGPIEAKLERAQGDNVWLMLGLREGKNREVKRVLEHLGLRVNRLIRVSFGPFQLGDLGEGAVEELRTAVLRDQLGPTLAAEAGVDFQGVVVSAAARGRATGAEREDHAEKRPERGGDAFEERVGGKGRGRDDVGRPSRSIWRDEETEAARPQGKRLPRRGADPQAARQESAAREHRRASPVSDPKGRRVLVERIVSEPAEAKPARRGPRPFRRDDAEARSFADKTRSFGDKPAGGKRFGDKPAGGRSFGDRPFGAKSFGDRARDGDGGKSPGVKSPGAKSLGVKSPGAKSFGGKPAGKSFGGKSFGSKSFGGKPSGGKPSGGKPSGGGKFGGRPGGGKPRRP